MLDPILIIECIIPFKSIRLPPKVISIRECLCGLWNEIPRLTCSIFCLYFCWWGLQSSGNWSYLLQRSHPTRVHKGINSPPHGSSRYRSKLLHVIIHQSKFIHPYNSNFLLKHLIQRLLCNGVVQIRAETFAIQCSNAWTSVYQGKPLTLDIRCLTCVTSLCPLSELTTSSTLTLPGCSRRQTTQ